MAEKKEENTVTDSRGGVKFGTNVAYDDAYGSTGHDNEYVSSLPTLDEERKMMADDDVRAREREEMEDAGRVEGMHPSSMNSMKVSLISFHFRIYEILWLHRISSLLGTILIFALSLFSLWLVLTLFFCNYRCLKTLWMVKIMIRSKMQMEEQVL